MNTGKIMAASIVISALLMGGVVWYMQVYGYYDYIDPQQGAQFLQITGQDGTLRPLPVADFEGIDADSSPLRYRSCFQLDPAPLADAQLYEKPTPLVGPSWFDCFSAGPLTRDLAAQTSRAYLLEQDIQPGFDRVMAVYPDGRAFAWHQLNGSAEEKKVIE